MRVAVAVQALDVTDRGFEVAGLVTFRTDNRFVLSLERETRSLMIEIGGQSRLTPAGCGMTAPAGRDERSFVWVGVAGSAV